MDRTKRLIRWQRIAIAALLVALVAQGYVNLRERQNLNEARQAKQSLLRGNLLLSAERDDAEARHAVENQTWQWSMGRLEKRLSNYEAKYGASSEHWSCESISVSPNIGPLTPSTIKKRIAEALDTRRD